MNHTATIDNKELRWGDQIKDFRGETWYFQRVTRPKTPGRSAKVEVSGDAQSGTVREFYADVFPGLEVTA